MDGKLGGILALLVVLAIGGCGGSGPMEITGAVTFAGAPLENGTIEFEPSDGKGPLAAGVIKDGRYTLQAMPGPKRVRIEGSKVIGRRQFTPGNPASPMVDITEPIVPERFNTKTTLTHEIIRGTSTCDFDLK
ncbi:MAG: hypothetical protein NTW96_05755 [Planctomycetia bacterium]|nr:hypothetical protein [Planctomycetia bacterium]